VVPPTTLAVESGRVRWAIVALSVAVVLAVAVAMALGPKGAGGLGASPHPLARLNVALNAGAGVCLLVGYAFVRAGRIVEHRRCMLVAFTLSSAFLVSYLAHHALVGTVPFRGAGFWRPLYFSILIPHVILAAGIVPLALFTLYRGWSGRIAAHRRIARYTFPLWLFVSLSGVVVFAMLYHLP
jgi:putative membrane protein